MSITTTLQEILNSKNAIKQALVDQGLSPTDDFSTYPGLVASLSAGGGTDPGGTDDFSTAQIGDYIEGGVYAGTITYPDNRQFHLIVSEESGQIADPWGPSGITTGVTDAYDGKANQDNILTNHDDGSSYSAFYHCRDFAAGGFSDWYLPASQEAKIIIQALLDSHPEFSIARISTSTYFWGSDEHDANQAKILTNGGGIGWQNKGGNRFVRPIRRIPV